MVLVSVCQLLRVVVILRCLSVCRRRGLLGHSFRLLLDLSLLDCLFLLCIVDINCCGFSFGLGPSALSRFLCLGRRCCCLGCCLHNLGSLESHNLFVKSDR